MSKANKFFEDLPESMDFTDLGDLDKVQDDFCRGLEDIETRY